MNLNFDFSETSDFWLFRIFGIDLQVPEVDRRLMMSPVRPSVSSVTPVTVTRSPV